MQNIESYREYTRKYSKETYDFRKAHKICARCGKENAEPGTVFCLVCKMDERDRSLNYYHSLSPDKKNAMLDRKRSQYQERKNKGLCVKCGEPAHNGRTLCERHREKDKWYRHRRYLKLQSIAAEV